MLLFSIIIPLEVHRGKAMKSVRAWAREQTFERSLYELIVVVPPDFPRDELQALRALLVEHDRVLHSPEKHDMTLCVAGAAAAQGSVLFFTESHVWPEPDVLEKSQTVLDVHPEWSAFSCTSERVTGNRLSVLEADMYEADIEYGMTKHPWRKILDQCFVTRREPYFAAGGFPHEFGHFAEWVLAARYHALGHRIGYAPEIRLHHQYIGDLRELRKFSCDFIDGEFLFHSRSEESPGDELIEPYLEWVNRGSWDPRLAREMLRWIVQRRLRAVQWLPAAIGGGAFAQVAALLEEWRLSAAIAWTSRFGSIDRARRVFEQYIAVLVWHRRMHHIARFLRQRRCPDPRATAVVDQASWSPIRPAGIDAVGFHQTEAWNGVTFRWSEAAALTSLRLKPGDYTVRMECPSIRNLANGLHLRFRHNAILSLMTPSRSARALSQFKLRCRKTPAPVYHGSVSHSSHRPTSAT